MIVLPNGNTYPDLSPQPTWKCLEVTEIATGQRILIKDFGYNPQLHKDPVEHAKPSLGSANERVVISTTQDVKPLESKENDLRIDPEIPHVIITTEERYAHLKAKGWKSLSKEERVNYQELKKQLEPNTKTIIESNNI